MNVYKLFLVLNIFNVAAYAQSPNAITGNCPPNAITGNCPVGTMSMMNSGAITCTAVSSLTNYSNNIRGTTTSSSSTPSYSSNIQGTTTPSLGVGVKAPTLSELDFNKKFTKRTSLSSCANCCFCHNNRTFDLRNRKVNY